MKPLVPRPIEWIGDAQVRIAARAVSAAAPAEVFGILADHERWADWFPSIRSVQVLGPAAGVGARRRVVLRGATIEEEFIVWQPGVRWAFTGTAASPRILRSLVEDCRLEVTGDGGTTSRYGMYLDAPRHLRPLVRAMAGTLQANCNRGLANLAERATRR